MEISIQVDENNKIVKVNLDITTNPIVLDVDGEDLDNLLNKPCKYIEGVIIVDSVEEQIRIKEELISQHKKYLLDTDYIVIKINEYKLQDKPVDSLLIHYSSELAEREVKREMINTLEQEIINLQL